MVWSPGAPFRTSPRVHAKTQHRTSERLEEFLQRETFDAEQEIFELEQDFKNNLKIVEDSEDPIVKDELEEELEDFEETVLSITKPLLVRIDDDSDDEDEYKVQYKKQDRFTADEVVELLRLRMMQLVIAAPLLQMTSNGFSRCKQDFDTGKWFFICNVMLNVL